MSVDLGGRSLIITRGGLMSKSVTQGHRRTRDNGQIKLKFLLENSVYSMVDGS